MRKFKSITVFCGSSPGKMQSFVEEAYALGKYLAENKIKLIYGGGRVGLMGAVANGVLENEGEVIGVIPNFLSEMEVAHDGLTELIKVDSMHERKLKMNELCEAVITLPGGYGTMEELFEMITWSQLGLHQKPIGILNVNAYYDPLLELITEMVNKGFVRDLYRKLIIVENTIPDLILAMRHYEAPEFGKWISEGQE